MGSGPQWQQVHSEVESIVICMGMATHSRFYPRVLWVRVQVGHSQSSPNLYLYGGFLRVCHHPKLASPQQKNNTNVLFCVHIDSIFRGSRISSSLPLLNVIRIHTIRSLPPMMDALFG